MATHSSEPIKVMIWGPPRSLSTVFEKCMSYVDDVQIVNEPYNSAATNVAERRELLNQTPLIQDGVDKFKAEAEKMELKGNITDVGWEQKSCTYAWMKNLLEGDFPGKKVVFVKDIQGGIIDHFNMLPKGYRHTFLIRNPIKMLISLRKLCMKMFSLSEDQFSLSTLPAKLRYQYEPITELMEYVKKNMGETSPLIIDADDLQNHPASILRQYCEGLGIPYKDSLLQWPAGDDCVKKNWLVSKFFLQGDQILGYYARALASTKFEASRPVPPENEIPADVLEQAKIEEPFYQKLYELRIKP